jgi:hypothetical protein
MRAAPALDVGGGLPLGPSPRAAIKIFLGPNALSGPPMGKLGRGKCVTVTMAVALAQMVATSTVLMRRTRLEEKSATLRGPSPSKYSLKRPIPAPSAYEPQIPQSAISFSHHL